MGVGVVVGEEDEDAEEEPAEAGEVVRRHGRRRRPGGGDPRVRVRVVRGAEAAATAAAGPCTHLTLTTPASYMWQATETEHGTAVRGGRLKPLKLSDVWPVDGWNRTGCLVSLQATLQIQ